MPRATGRDGTPPSFVVLATADLRHWRRYGQGGAATMGVFDLGAGTVFTAATVNWGKGLSDPVVDRITRNVLDRFYDCLAGLLAGRWLDGDRAARRTPRPHHLRRRVLRRRRRRRPARPRGLRPEPFRGAASATRRTAVPRVPTGGRGRDAARPVGAHRHGPAVLPRPGLRRPAWTDVTAAPPGAHCLALCDAGLFAGTADDALWYLPALELRTGAWRPDRLRRAAASP